MDPDSLPDSRCSMVGCTQFHHLAKNLAGHDQPGQEIFALFIPLAKSSLALRRVDRALVSAALIGPGKAFELLDVKSYLWPGHGTPPDTSYQCIEDEFMTADEYDPFISDPSNFFVRSYLPRVLGAIGPWSMLNPWTNIVELPFVGLALIPAGIPPVQQAFQKFLEAGQVIMEWITAVGPIEEAGRLGYIWRQCAGIAAQNVHAMIDTGKEYGIY